MTSQTTRGHKRKLADNNSGPSPSREPSSLVVEAEVSRTEHPAWCSLSRARLSSCSPCRLCSHGMHLNAFLSMPSGHAHARDGAPTAISPRLFPHVPNPQVKSLIQTIRDLSSRPVEKIDRAALRKAAHSLADYCKTGEC
jgi:hypothetical protein